MNEIKEAVQAIREIAITELMLDNENLKKAMIEYLKYRTYNKINGKQSTLENLNKEAELKVELAEMTKLYEPEIERKMLEIVNR